MAVAYGEVQPASWHVYKTKSGAVRFVEGIAIVDMTVKIEGGEGVGLLEKGVGMHPA